jgi:hypothetical protein
MANGWQVFYCKAKGEEHMKINTGCWVDGCKRFDPNDEDGVEIKRDREWQGLTEGETIKLALDAFQLPEFSLEARLKMQNELVKAMNEQDSRVMIFAATIEQALREKNSA